MRFGGSNVNDQVHTGSEFITALQEYFGQSYFMVDTIKIAQWKFGPEKRTILGYECSVAYYTDNSKPEQPVEVTAWYTPKIRPFVGPDHYNTVPGGILALDINAGEHYWVARKIELRELTEDEKITAPVAKKNSKLVTFKEFEKAKVDQMTQMRNRMGGMR
jgi:GLPGLI family protein